MSRGHLHDGAPAPLPLRAGTTSGAAAAGGATLLTPLAAVEEWLADTGFLEEVLAGIEDGMVPGTPEEAFNHVLAEAEANLATVRSPLDAEMWGSEMLGVLTSSGFDLCAAEDFVAEAIVPMAEDAGTPTALAMLVVLSGIGGPRLSGVAAGARRRGPAADLSVRRTRPMAAVRPQPSAGAQQRRLPHHAVALSDHHRLGL